MPGPQPSWQREPCPRWCVREHRESDLPLDRYHQGTPWAIPVAMSTDPAEPRTTTFATVEVSVHAGRYVGELVDWVAIEPLGPEPQRLVLTAESAQRLARQITERANDLDG